MRRISLIIKSIARGRFSMMLLSFALMFFVVPLIPAERIVLDRIFGIFSLVVLLCCLRAVMNHRGFFVFMVVLSLINLGVGIPEIFSRFDATELQVLAMGVRLLFYLCAFISIMRYVLDRSPVTADKVCGAISAYVLMGIIWAIVYAIFYRFQPASFSFSADIPPGGGLGMWSIYYSFVTLTTLGYGDINPVLPPAQAYACMEAACGQIFLTVLIARLVALQILNNTKEGG